MGSQQHATSTFNGIPKIISDTDMGPDYDDVGAIAVLHALADSGECEILATVASSGHPSIAPTIELFNRYFKRPNLLVGVPAKDAPDFTAQNNWNELTLEKFAPELKNRTYPGAVSVYRETLAGQPDKSVTMVTVGFLSNISDLLESGPDEHSELSGRELVEAKVQKLVAMAGVFPEGKEFNVFKDAEPARIAIAEWPTPILFSSFEIGSKIFTGGSLMEKGDEDGPVAFAYDYNLKTYGSEVQAGRQSWDQTAVLVAVRNPERYFYVNGPGKLIIHEDGSNTGDPDSHEEHYFLVHGYSFGHIAGILEQLMLHQPK